MLATEAFQTNASLLAESILTALAAGTFIYVGFVEVVAKEVRPQAPLFWLRILFVIVGCAGMGALALWV